MTDFIAPPQWSGAFGTGKGTKAVEGVLEIVFHGAGRFQVNTDRGPVRCKGRTYNFRGEFVRTADGEIIDGRFSHSCRDYVSMADPTPAVRKLIIEAARDFGATHWTTEQDAAGEIAAAEREIYFAQKEVDDASAKLATAADKLDRAKERKTAALCDAPAAVTSTWAARA